MKITVADVAHRSPRAVRFAGLLIALAGCGSPGGSDGGGMDATSHPHADLTMAAGVDLANSMDLWGSADFSVSQDLAIPEDLSIMLDFAKSQDLTVPVDYSVLPDLVMIADLSPPPDLTPPLDLTPPPDLTAPTCMDHVKNGKETDVDCGGPDCPACGTGKACLVVGDCASGICDGMTCRLPFQCAELKAQQPNRPTGSATIDPDGPNGSVPQLTVWCDMTSDGGGFTLVFNHDLAKGGYMQGFDEAALSNPQDPTAAKYSILKYLSAFAHNGAYTFRINWPGYAKRNLWSQTTNPTDDVSVAGYQVIDVQSTSNLWGGLELGNGAHGPPNGNSSYLDGSINHSNWYYAIGTRVMWGNPNGFPASDDVAGGAVGVNQTQLWVK